MLILKAIGKTIWYCIIVILITIAVLGGVILLVSLPELDKLANGWISGGFVIVSGITIIILIGWAICITFQNQYGYYLNQSNKEENTYEIIVEVTKYYKQIVKAKHKRLVETDCNANFDDIKADGFDIKIKRIKEL